GASGGPVHDRPTWAAGPACWMEYPGWRRCGPGPLQRMVTRPRSPSCTPDVHHVCTQDVLAAVSHRGSLVQLPVHEHQGHPALRLDFQTRHPVIEIELRLPTGEVIIEVHHERQPAFLAVVAVETAVPVGGELLPRVITVEAEALVEARDLPVADTPRQERLRALPQ